MKNLKNKILYLLLIFVILSAASCNKRDLSDEEFADMALQQAKMLHSLDSSMLVCDSALNVASNYYEKRDKRYAEAMMYLGCIAFEAGDMETAIANYLAALDVVEKRGDKEKSLKSEIYGLMGNAYYHAGLYEGARDAYENSYRNADEREQVIALHGMAKSRFWSEGEESAAATMKRAMQLSERLNDSILILKSIYNTAVMYEALDSLDTARRYMERTIPYLENLNINKGIYYTGIGVMYHTIGEKELANEYINRSLGEDLTSLQRLSAYEMLFDMASERGEYSSACGYASVCMALADSLEYVDKASDVERLAYNYKTKLRLHEAKRHSQIVLITVICCAVVACLLIVVIYQRRLYQRRRKQMLSEQALKEAKMKIEALHKEIADNQEIITLLNNEHTDIEQERQAHAERVKSREEMIDRLKEESVHLRGWMLGQTDIFKKVMELAGQKVNNKKEAKVLSLKEQDKLQATVFDIYSDYVEEMRTAYPKLTDADLLFLCLQTTELTTFGLALCFGSSDSQVARQRKSRLKAKMTSATTDDSDGQYNTPTFSNQYISQ